MTPEERFTKIENVIENLIETQGRHDAIIEKQNAGIGDLIRLSGIFLESQKQIAGNVERLAEAQREAQRHTDESLNRLGEKIDQLSDSVDRFLKGLQKPNGNQ